MLSIRVDTDTVMIHYIISQCRDINFVPELYSRLVRIIIDAMDNITLPSKNYHECNV